MAVLTAACSSDRAVYAPTSLTVVSGNGQAAIIGQVLAKPVIVKVTGASGNPMTGVQVIFTISGGGAVANPTAVTDASGMASSGTWTLGATSGTDTVTASVANARAVTVTAQALPYPTITGLGIFPTYSVLYVGQSLTLQITSTDANGAPDTNYATKVSGTAVTLTGKTVNAVASGSAAIVATTPHHQRQVSAISYVAVTPATPDSGATYNQLGTGGATCGITATGAAFCWGWPGAAPDGVLGSATCTTGNCGLVPVAVSGGLSFAMISGGGYTTCGVTTGGAAYCWGFNYAEQLGVPTSQTPQTCPAFDAPNQPCSTTPVAVSGGNTFRSIAATFDATCALTPAGAAMCWGSDVNGELGDSGVIGSTKINSVTATPVPVSGGHVFAALFGGDGYFFCGLGNDQVVYCWGFDHGDELRGSGCPSFPTVQICTIVPSAVPNIPPSISVAVGATGACALATSGTVYCWGNDITGAILVTNAPPFVSLTGTGDTYCGMTAKGAAYCWQVNQDYAPTPTAPGLSLKSIVAGGSSYCAISTSGRTYCWGASAGGSGVAVPSDIPVLVAKPAS